MFLTVKQAEERLNSEKNLASRFNKNNDNNNDNFGRAIKQPIETYENSQVVSISEKTIHLPGKIGINLSEEIRTQIAIRARAGESQPSLAREFGVTQANISSIERGNTKGINEDQVKKTIDSARDLALERLMQSLGLLTEDKLSGCSAKDLSVIASNMGRVVEKINPKTEQPDNINFIIYAPELKQEKSYKTIEI